MYTTLILKQPVHTDSTVLQRARNMCTYRPGSTYTPSSYSGGSLFESLAATTTTTTTFLVFAKFPQINYEILI